MSGEAAVLIETLAGDAVSPWLNTAEPSSAREFPVIANSSATLPPLDDPPVENEIEALLSGLAAVASKHVTFPLLVV
jgi:hypothetical protein